MIRLRFHALILAGALSLAGCGGAVGTPLATNCPGPASGTFQASQALGGYYGMTLPSTFSSLTTEAQVDAAITRASSTSDWTCFQAYYGGAVTKWRENTGKK
jgi:hypothetical protein